MSSQGPGEMNPGSGGDSPSKQQKRTKKPSSGNSNGGGASSSRQRSGGGARSTGRQGTTNGGSFGYSTSSHSTGTSVSGGGIAPSISLQVSSSSHSPESLAEPGQLNSSSNSASLAAIGTSSQSSRRSGRMSSRYVDDDEFSVAPGMDRDVKSVVSVSFDDVYKRGRKVRSSICIHLLLLSYPCQRDHSLAGCVRYPN
jgi:hypothetical protein